MTAGSAPRSKAALTEFLHEVLVMDFDGVAASSAAVVRATLEARGAPIGPYDTLIAGHALALGVPLVTRSRREFGRVEGLMVEVW